MKAGIPYTLVGGVRFWERKEVQDVLAYLRLALSPGDDLAARRAINTPARGIGKRTVEKLEQAGGGSVACALFPDPGRPESELELSLDIRKSYIDKLRDFRELILGLRQLAAEESSLPRLLRSVIERTGYGRMLEEDSEEGPGRLANLETLVEAAESYTASLTFGVPDDALGLLQAFLDRCALASGEEEGSSEQGSTRVRIMTMHVAKGLEFEAVLVPGCVEGVLPRAAREDDQNVARLLEEEARLFYVAVTRAKRHLHLFVPAHLPANLAGFSRLVERG